MNESSESEVGDIVTGEGIDKTDSSTWPKPPVEGEVTEGDPSRAKPRKRGEKSVYDENGGEWRPHTPDKYHPEGHWDYKEHEKAPWKNKDTEGRDIDDD